MSTFKGFSQVKMQRPQKSSFNLSHDKKITTRMGRLTPVLLLEAVPSDSFRISTEMLVRLAPLLAPIYDQINVFVHFFFVPNRLLWEDWEEFITGGRLGVGVDPATAPIPPYVDCGTVEAAWPGTLSNKGSFADHIGIPPFMDIDPDPADWEGCHIDVMPALACQLIWYEYYRDRNFVADGAAGGLGFDLPIVSGAVNSLAEDIFRQRTRCYTHDYFTSALPFTQRGEEVLMPVQLGGKAPLYVDPISGSATSVVLSGIEQPGSVATAYGLVEQQGGAPAAGQDLWIDGADFDGTTTSINDFRSAYALQVWLERNAVGGSRYTESTQAHFGVKPQDSRLQRPEYLGGGMVPVKISEVVSTAWSKNIDSVDVPQGNMAGHGVTYGNTNRCGYFCTEHGFIVGVLSIMNPPSYQNGLSRMFRRRSFLDYPWPTFAKLGEQEVADFEIYMSPASMTPDSDGEYPAFGYQSRYADWKYIKNSTAGDFRDTLAFWGLTRIFTDQPVLSEAFNLFDDDTQNRIFAVENVDCFWIYLHNEVHVKRPLPYFGIPNNLGFQ